MGTYGGWACIDVFGDQMGSMANMTSIQVSNSVNSVSNYPTGEKQAKAGRLRQVKSYQKGPKKLPGISKKRLLGSPRGIPRWKDGQGCYASRPLAPIHPYIYPHFIPIPSRGLSPMRQPGPNRHGCGAPI